MGVKGRGSVGVFCGKWNPQDWVAVCLRWSLGEKTLLDSQNFDSCGPGERLPTVVAIEGELHLGGLGLVLLSWQNLCSIQVETVRMGPVPVILYCTA